MAFNGEWEAMFTASVPGNAAPTLGIDYIAASAPVTSIGGVALAQDLDSLGIAGVVWNCARVVAEFLEQHSELIDQQRVIELGAGTGAVGLAIAVSCSPLAVVMTDLDTVVAKLTQRNVSSAIAQHPKLQAMAAAGRMAALDHRWGTPLPKELAEGCDVVICSDCLYEPAAYDALLATLKELNAATVLVAYKQRHPERERQFFSTASALFEMAAWSDAGDRRPLPLGGEAIFLMRFRRRQLGRPEAEE